MNTRSRKSSTRKPVSRQRQSSHTPDSPHAQTLAPVKKRASTAPRTKGKSDMVTSPALIAAAIADSVLPVPAFEHQEKLVRSLLQSTVRHIESNSILICGPRGCGKSTFLAQCLKSECDPKTTEIVRFSGFMDTEASKLFQSMRAAVESEDRSITVLMEKLRQKCQMSDSTIVIVLDEFDRFCKPMDQTFLYNIFDMTQKCRHLCVIGVTTRLDCMELVEKRVKSRMNQTIIYLNKPFADVAEYVSFSKKIRSSAGGVAVTDIAHYFGRNTSIRGLKRLMIENISQTCCVSGPQESDPIVQSMLSLSHMEFFILFVSETLCRNSGSRALTCDSILKELSKFSGRTRISTDLGFKLIDNLVAYGFLKKASIRENRFLSEWTILHLNFGIDELRAAVSHMHSSLPAHMQVLIHL